MGYLVLSANNFNDNIEIEKYCTNKEEAIKELSRVAYNLADEYDVDINGEDFCLEEDSYSVYDGENYLYGVVRKLDKQQEE